MQSRSAFVTASLALVSFLALGACTGVIGGGEGADEGNGGSTGAENGTASSGAGGMGGAGVGGAGSGGAGAGGAGAG
ncbi:hypothetical protein QHF84_17985, partial [Polyangium sp. y55x31]